VTAFLTAFYTFRAYFMTFWGKEVIPPEAAGHGHGAGHTAGVGHGDPHAPQVTHGKRDDEPVAHKPTSHGGAHESPPVMTIPLMVLAVFALAIGFLVGPLMPKNMQFAHFLAKTPYFPQVNEEHVNWLMMTGSSLIALAGIGLAWLMYIRSPAMPAELARKVPLLYQASLNKFYFDELYYAWIVQPFQGLATFLRQIDLNVVDALVDLVGHVPRLLGGLFRPVQNGLVQFYALAMILGLTVFVLALVRAL
jgi:NADH-quinone oxidoreductase subunit L